MISEETHAVRSALRSKALELRSDLSEPIRVAYSKLIEQSFLRLFPAQEISCIHCYLSYRSEVDTAGIIRSFLQERKKVIVPYLRSETDGRFSNSTLTSLDDLHKGPFGIPQPKTLDNADISALEAVIIPLAAFDGFGRRLGYGKGFYDKFLASLPMNVKKVGFAYSIQEVDEIPHAGHDQLLDLIITEQGIVTPSVAFS